MVGRYNAALTVLNRKDFLCLIQAFIKLLIEIPAALIRFLVKIL